MNAAETLEKEITQCLPHLNVTQKKTVLTVVKTFMKEQNDWWEEISQEQQQAIDKAIAGMNAGKLTTHSEVMKKYKKWVKK